MKKYRPISLLAIRSKIFERIIQNKMFTVFAENKLISPDQSRFKEEDCHFNQLLAISNDIYKSFDNSFEVRGIFLYQKLSIKCGK